MSLPQSSAGPNLLLSLADLLDPPDDPYRQDPLAWISERQGEFFWSKQRQIAESVRDNLTAPRSKSCHDVGK